MSVWDNKSPWYNRTSWLGVKHQLTYLRQQPSCAHAVAQNRHNCHVSLRQQPSCAHAVVENRHNYHVSLRQLNRLPLMSVWSSSGENLFSLLSFRPKFLNLKLHCARVTRLHIYTTRSLYFFLFFCILSHFNILKTQLFSSWIWTSCQSHTVTSGWPMTDSSHPTFWQQTPHL